MDRKVYISDDSVSLAEYVEAQDDADCYACWQDPDTQEGYNHKSDETFAEFTQSRPIQHRFIATILRNTDGVRIGVLFVSPEGTVPDLAIMIFRPYRRNGYGTRAFALAARYCLEQLKLDSLHAGCYPTNAASLNMLRACGFVPYPEGNIPEKHFRTGKDIEQLDFIKISLAH